GRAGTRNRGRRARMGQRTRQPLPPYAELHCLSHFSFQRGASSAQELFERAKKLGYAALAITDECSLAGIVRALEASEETGVPLIVGSELTLTDGTRLVLLCEDQVGYASLCRLITRARRNAAKGEYRLSRAELEESRGDGLLALLVPTTADVDAALHPAIPDAGAAHGCDRGVAVFPGDRGTPEHPGRSHGQLPHQEAILERLEWAKRAFPGRTWLAIELHRSPDDAARLQLLDRTGRAAGVP